MCDSINAIDPDLREAAMKTIDEMLNLALLTPDEHQQIRRDPEDAAPAVAGGGAGECGDGD